MNKKLFVNSVLMMIWNGLILGLFGTGLVFTIAAGLDLSSSPRLIYYTSIAAQGIISVNALVLLVKSYIVFKTENNNYKKEKLDKEITKRAAELIKEKEGQQ
jgi:cytochrome bd-type quinol oxidase subunit 2